MFNVLCLPNLTFFMSSAYITFSGNDRPIIIRRSDKRANIPTD